MRRPRLFMLCALLALKTAVGMADEQIYAGEGLNLAKILALTHLSLNEQGGGP